MVSGGFGSVRVGSGGFGWVQAINTPPPPPPVTECQNARAATENLTSSSRGNEKGNTTKKDIPRWNEDIEPYRQDALFWHAVWLSAGRPINSELHNVMKRTRNMYHLHIRKNKRVLDKMKSNRLLEACLNNQNGIFKEIKIMRNNKQSFPNNLDGKDENIPQYFANKYENFYNSVDDSNDLLIVEESISQRIKNTDTCEVLKKSSEIFSDYLINAPDILYQHLSDVIKTYITHGHLTQTLAIYTLLPMIKDKLCKASDSNNYRSIAISSVILKLLDWVILLYKDSLHLDTLQFSYQPNCSTTMCTWMVIETIDYFLRNNSEVFICTMDMTKAFKKVKHSILFHKLLKRHIPPIILRFLLHAYKIQVTMVRWNGNYSAEFSIKHGVKQGAVLSALLYCVYVDDLFLRLRKNRQGCWINGEFMGIFGCADNNVLLPKCMAFTKKERDLRSMMLCGNSLPWVKSTRHLGNKIEDKIDGTRQDLREKRSQFIQKYNEICQEFSFADSTTKIRLNNIFNTHFTGSPIWDLFLW